jgi:NAD-dependent dihydropyrimidine dehydrogenase PreA subunit
MPLLDHLREKLPWFPTLDPNACRMELECLNSCPHDVFEWDAKSGRPIVAHPLRCSPGCNICTEVCDAGAISLPTKGEFQVAMRKLRNSAERPDTSRLSQAE